jgi:hypothetical protein
MTMQIPSDYRHESLSSRYLSVHLHMLRDSRNKSNDHVFEQHLSHWLQHESHHTPPWYLRTNTTPICRQRCLLLITVMCVIRDPSLRRLCRKAIYFDRHYR